MTVVMASSDPRLDGGYRNGVSAVRVRPGASRSLDTYSDVAENDDWARAEEATLTRVAFAPVDSSDALTINGRWVESTLALWSLNHDLDVEASDRIRYGGALWEVTGEGARWHNPFSGRKVGAVFGLKVIP